VSVSRIFASCEIEDWNENVVVSEIRCSVFYEAGRICFVVNFVWADKAPRPCLAAATEQSAA